jgi:UDP-N-acetylglucosamine 3-dehydrogenase
MLRAGLVGLGAMGRHHARVLRSLEGVTLVGAADPAGDRYQAAPGIPIVPSLTELLRLDLDYAVLACPTLLHHPLGIELAAAGVPTLIEKPLAATPETARLLNAAFEAAGVPAAVGYIERFNPALIATRTRLQAGLLGHVFSISTRRTGPYPTRIPDVGVIHDLATHDLDLTAWITGARYTSIAAHTARRRGQEHEDLFVALGRLSDGTITNHQNNWISPLKERLIVVTGDLGGLVADTLTGELTYRASNSDIEDAEPLGSSSETSSGEVEAIRYRFPDRNPLVAEHEAFRDQVLGRSHSTATLQDGLDAVLTADAAIRAARTGATVAMPGLEAHALRL